MNPKLPKLANHKLPKLVNVKLSDLVKSILPVIREGIEDHKTEKKGNDTRSHVEIRRPPVLIVPKQKPRKTSMKSFLDTI